MKEYSEEHISRVLSDIQARAPKNLREAVIEEVPLTPTMNFIMRKALEEDISEEKKEHIRTLLASGDLDKKVYKENPRIVKLLDEYMTREIRKAVRAGQLPKKSELKNLEHFKKIYERISRETNQE